MKFQPLTCVWEITMGCNMRCKHCGSSCAEPLPDELTTEEAFSFIDQCADIGLKWITLSGGEPLTRKDVVQLVERLSSHGITVNIITNGWLMNEEMVHNLKAAGIKTVAISIDGTREIHNSIRREASYEHAEKSFQLLKQAGITAGAVTTISKQNIANLPVLKEELIRMGLDSWQLQIGLPMGNFSERPEWLIEPAQVDDIIEFCYQTAIENRIKIFPADCIGYYNRKELKARQISFRNPELPLWDGCNAGIRSFGILHNGDILGCTSIRAKEFVEGNIRERPLRTIWEDETKFLWRRNLTKKDLSNECGKCIYGNKCLGGCPNTRLTIHKSIYAENDYCSYHLHLKSLRTTLSALDNVDLLWEKADNYFALKAYQETAYTLDRLLQLTPNHLDGLKLKGYVEYMCSNYELSEQSNRMALSIQPNDVYAWKGLGISLHKQGKSMEGITCLEKAAQLSNYSDEDVLSDLKIVQKEMQTSQIAATLQ
ncbi:radical SAM/SPASM domain-containing protein [Anaeromicropila populeti]|uniref:Radical SAM additional 4Fe4S-binding SPASM domain-containing protein n=1 Tax=Anaeromicropila populeti TaxID=37658 RepID=A0A1I6KYN7_9FIRM|nr:radical SAM protein [Anaeromicropila populeti]SFR96325.1 radical SAM additional 4Fe4S-binding SPASM domain-containing protein [Anaeromicropila populeti]